MKIAIAGLLAFIFLALALMHCYWGLGGKIGKSATIPTNESNKPVIKPGKADCFVVALSLLCFGMFILIKTVTISISLPSWLLNYGLWAIAALFVLRAIGEFKYAGFFKKIKTTEFAIMDTKYYSPLCLLIGFLAIVLALI